MAKVAEGQAGPIKWVIDEQGPALDFLTTKNRNALVRDAFMGAGKAWIGVFLPKRFSHYVDRSPFPYPRHRIGFYFQKAKRMGIVKGIIQRLSITKGWDPWSTEKPPLSLIIEWKKLNPGRYNFFNAQGSGLIADMRKNAKRAVFEVIDELNQDGKFIPLIQTGAARAFALEGARARATVTANKSVLKIPVPFGHAINATVGNVVRTIPTWEVNWIAKQFKDGIVSQLKSRSLSVGRDGVVTTRTVTAVTGRV